MIRIHGRRVWRRKFLGGYITRVETDRSTFYKQAHSCFEDRGEWLT